MLSNGIVIDKEISTRPGLQPPLVLANLFPQPDELSNADATGDTSLHPAIMLSLVMPASVIGMMPLHRIVPSERLETVGGKANIAMSRMSAGLEVSSEIALTRGFVGAGGERTVPEPVDLFDVL